MADYHIEIDLQQKMPKGETACGDVFYSRRISEERRTILVLSDGIGHGVKANVLATLTASMALNYTSFHTRPEVAANIFMRALPQSSEGKESYATFTILEIEDGGVVRIINYDNPTTIILRNGEPFQPREMGINIRGSRNAGKILRIREFKPMLEDRIIFFTDGITQSGLGSGRFPLGWEQGLVQKFAENQVARDPEIAANRLARKIINQAVINDDFGIKDDASCGVVYFREPRVFMLVTGPPFYKSKDAGFVKQISEFQGKKIVCGGTTAEIIARELNLELEIQQQFADGAVPPVASMAGFEMVTEGIITLGKVEELLENFTSETRPGNTAPDNVAKLLLQHDVIHILLGTRINWVHQDPSQPVEVEIRKFVVKRIVKLLEEKFFKKVEVQYV